MSFILLKHRIYVYIIVLLLTSCTTDITEPNISEYVYQLSKTEAKEKVLALLEQTVTILSETVIKQTVTPKENYYLIKNNSNATVHHSENSFFWDGDITKSPFGDTDSYNANYLSKLTFLDITGIHVLEPQLSDTTKSNFNVNTSFGFSNNNQYGDEIIYNISSFLLPVNKSKLFISSKSLYKRHWIGIYDGINSDLQYEVNIKTENLHFIYDYENSINWFNGKIIIEIGENRFIINLIESDNTFIEYYRNQKFIESYKYDIDSYNLFENLLTSNEHIFPGYTLVSSGFTNLTSNIN